jgi:hypothetical protein
LLFVARSNRQHERSKTSKGLFNRKHFLHNPNRLQMSKAEQINQMTTTQANTICLRFFPITWAHIKAKAVKMGEDVDKRMRTEARNYCRSIGKTPKEIIATPLPR